MRAFYCCTACVVVIDAEKIDRSLVYLYSAQKVRMTTLDEITKEKQRLSEALARVDAQHEKLISLLSELEAAERVLARYTIGTQTRKAAPARTTTTTTKVATIARAVVGGPQPLDRLAASPAQRAWAIRFLPSQPARRSRKLLPHAKGLARTMSAPRLPGTSGLGASRSATGSSTLRSRPARSNARRKKAARQHIGGQGRGIRVWVCPEPNADFPG
jgi:hypothetical protein